MLNSFYCGDAAGRPKDFSDSDRGFAQAAGLRFFTPEELFHDFSSPVYANVCA